MSLDAEIRNQQRDILAGESSLCSLFLILDRAGRKSEISRAIRMWRLMHEDGSALMPGDIIEINEKAPPIHYNYPFKAKVLSSYTHNRSCLVRPLLEDGSVVSDIYCWFAEGRDEFRLIELAPELLPEEPEEVPSELLGHDVRGRKTET